MIAVNTSEEEANSWADDKAKLAKMPPQNPQGSWTRTLRRWYVAIFMGFFSAALAAYWGLNLWVFYQTLDNYNPKRTVDSGFIGSNPGLGYRPMRLKTDPYSSLIWFRHGAIRKEWEVHQGVRNWTDLKKNLDEFLSEYEPGYWANAGASQTKCPMGRKPLEKDEACEFNKEWLSDQGNDIKCISEEYYGYYHGKPCILLKLNRVYGWQPQPYFNITQVDNHPEMPADLKHHIRKEWETHCQNNPDHCPQLNMVWLHCDGETDPDKENIGSVSYTPWRGFPAHFFPYWNQLGYLQPVVMVQLKNPTPGVLINIQCTAWANFIEHDTRAMKGSVHIEFLMD